MKEVKLCPFCGCHDRKADIRRIGNKSYSVMVCSNCGGNISYIAIKEWQITK